MKKPSRVYPGYWNNIDNQRKHLDAVGSKLNFKDTKDWYSITWDILRRHRLGSLLRKYNGSVSKLLFSVYPEYLCYNVMKLIHRYNWDIHKFKLPQNYWDISKNKRSFMDDLFHSLNITKTEDFFSITKESLLQHQGSGLLSKYNNSPAKLLADLFPQYKQSCRDFVNGIVTDLKLSKVEDILTIPVEYPKHCG